MRSTLKRIPLVVDAVRVARRLPGVDALRRAYADAFPATVFTSIYDENQWGDADSVSGDGSNMQATVVIRRELPRLIQHLGVRSLLDIPCGDFYWMRAVERHGATYVGGDIVRPLIERNRQQYAGDGVSFRVLNAATDALPTVDLVLCRDLLIHLSFAMIAKVVANIKASGSTWLAVSSYPHMAENEDIRTGGYHSVNLQAAPFDWPAPERLMAEEPNAGTSPHAKYLGLWRVADLP